MQEVQENFVQKEPDLKSYYKMAEEAFKADDVEEALKISKNGLEQAKLQERSDWVSKFDSFTSNVSELKSLTPSIKKESLTIVSGIGLKVAQKLTSIGITSVSELAHASPTNLSRIEGIGASTAQKFIQSAQELLRVKKLNDFSEEEIEKSSHIQQSLQMLENIEDNLESTPVEPKIDDYEEEINQEEYEEIDVSEEELMTPEMKNLNPETILKEKELAKEESPSQVVISPEMARQSTFSLQERETSSKEVLSRTQVEQRHTQIIKKLELAQFDIIERLPELRAIFTGIDLLAIRHVRVKEFLDFIYLIPIKFNTLKGTLTISKDTVQYKPTKNKSADNAYQMGKLTSSYLKALSQTERAITSNMVDEGYLLPYLSKYVGHSITLEKSMTKRNLFFRSGPLQYKILIEPILLCENSVGFTEKLISFAYHKDSNIHIIEHSKLTDLLQFIDQKYFLIETYTEEQNALALEYEASTKFVSDLRKYSAPFMFYGVAVLFLLLFQSYSVLPLFINLGYGILSFYFVLVFYLYLNFYKQKTAIHQEFSTPYYLKNIEFDETTLILINEELSSKLMEQFIYECIGKNVGYNIVNKIEKDNAERYLLEKVRKKRLEESALFQSEISLPSESMVKVDSVETSRKPELKNKFVDKYSSFLED